MKLIGVLHGIAAFRENIEEYVPERLPPSQEFVQTLRDTYQFQQFPVFLPNVQINTWYFMHGKYVDERGSFGISQLIMSPKGDSVATAHTDQSDVVLDHLINLMDTRFGYRLKQSRLKKIYWSNIVVEFEPGIEEALRQIAAIERIVTNGANKGRPFKIKSLTFGTSPTPTVAMVPNQDVIDFTDAVDFSIERRADQPFEQNRYFSSAPMRTEDHKKALQDIEKALLS